MVLTGICIGLFPDLVLPQSDSAIVLKLNEVEIRSERLETFGTGKHLHSIDSNQLSTYASQNLASLLHSEGLLFVKSYGVGSLASLALRGTGASHTAVLWNGFNMQSPMNGNFDLSLVPLFFVDDIKIQYGGNAALFGQGNMGGAIHLNSKAHFEKDFHTSLFVEAGSFEKSIWAFSIAQSEKKYSSSLKLFHSFSKNDFSFSNIAKAHAPIEKLENAACMAQGILWDNALKIKENQELNLHFWYQNQHRHIPPSMTQSRSLSFQDDASYRGAINWKQFGKKGALTIRMAYFNDFVAFTDPLLDMDDKNRSQSFVTETESRYPLQSWILLNTGLHYSYARARVDAYNSDVFRNTMALFTSLKAHALKQKLLSTFSFRQEWTENTGARFLPSAAVEYTLWKFLKIKAHSAVFYRLPTFNDLYWQPGGNPDLKAEEGWNTEGGMELFLKPGDHSVQMELSAYHSRIRNWILWIPDNNQLWKAENVNIVQAQGIETQCKYSFSWNNLWMVFRANYQYSASINKESRQQNPETHNKQLIYTPEHIAGFGLMIRLLKKEFYYSHSYTGKRFVLYDNSDCMEAFQKADLRLTYQYALNKLQGSLYLGINNIWDEEYQSIQWRPMPARHYYAGIQMLFKETFK
jgi:vitamin B12 transporter